MNIDFQQKGKLPTDSLELLKSLKGCIITGLGKSLSWEPGDFSRTFGVEKDKLFELGSGILFIEFDGKRTFSFYGFTKKTSITVLEETEDYLSIKKRSQYWTSAKDSEYSCSNWTDLVGQKVEALEIAKYVDGKLYGSTGMNERGIVFTSKHRKFIFCHALASKGPTDSVIMDFKHIESDIFGKVKLISV
jgi:hypothetical protein